MAASAIAVIRGSRIASIVDQFPALATVEVPQKGRHGVKRATYPVPGMKYLLGSLYLIPLVGIGLKFAGC